MFVHLPGEKLGRKKTLIIGVIIMSIGAILQTCAFSVQQMIVARIITGVFFRFSLECDLNLNFIPGLGNGLVPPHFYGFLYFIY
jgi:MFS family permease